MEKVFGQTFQLQDLGLIGVLVLLEGILSIDNALVLALLAKRLPKPLQAKALTYGLVGAFVFRFFAIGAAQYLLQWRIFKLIGGSYLLWVALVHLISQLREKSEERLTLGPDGEPIVINETTGGALTSEQEEEEISTRSALPIRRSKQPGFWATIAVIEMTDIAFAIDSIVAAIGIVGPPPIGHIGPHPRLWVVITGGMLGVLLMRVAAAMFIRLLERFPRFETSAYFLVAVIGMKLVVDWGFNTQEPHLVDFDNPTSFAFWIFWLSMAVCIGFGFLPKKKGSGGSVS